jgi:hypothetical protein
MMERTEPRVIIKHIASSILVAARVVNDDLHRPGKPTLEHDGLGLSPAEFKSVGWRVFSVPEGLADELRTAGYVVAEDAVEHNHELV